jgi:hypothetical protein
MERSEVRKTERTVSGCRRVIARAAVAALFGACATIATRAQAQQPYSSVVMTAPTEDAVDENFVSVLTGKLHFSIPGTKLGDVSFTAFTTNEFFTRAADDNYGYIAICENVNGTVSYETTTECSTAQGTIEAVYGEQRAGFAYGSGGYSPATDGSTLVDNGSTCTWTQRDGTQIVFVAFHASGNPNCLSNNVSKVIHADGRIETYYYYGSFSTSIVYTPSPIISIASNSGYLLKYNYSGTPTWGLETSVVAIDRAFETCDPTALSCALTHGPWPTATLSWVSSPYSFTLTDQANRKHVFGLDNFGHVVSYQPPQATTPLYTYNICTLQADGHTMTHCFGTTYYPDVAPGAFDPAPLLWDLVESSSRNGQTWNYDRNYVPGSPPYGWSVWTHSVYSPLGTQMVASGNATPFMETYYGPTDNVTHYDGTLDHLERSIYNRFQSRQTPLGIVTSYQYGGANGQLTQIGRTPVSGSGLSTTYDNAQYPTSCSSLVNCFKPIAVLDANNNETDYQYDPVHGGVLTVTGAAVNTPAGSGIRPQTRYTYVQRNAWYLSSSGVMTRDSNPIWVLATESFCRKGAAVSPPGAPGAGCTLANDEVVTTYDYGPDSGPNSLLVRGKTVAADGQTLRTCDGHDPQGNKIWETSPNAQPASCPAY